MASVWFSDEGKMRNKPRCILVVTKPNLNLTYPFVPPEYIYMSHHCAVLSLLKFSRYVNGDWEGC